jgi:uncharacterized protein (UPF0335 family)
MSESPELLKAFVDRVKRLEDERADLAADAAEVVKEARGAGFDGTKIREVVRWLRKVEKHGREAVDEAEALFDLYRSFAEPGTASFDDMMEEARDKALLRVFAPDDQIAPKLTRRRQAMQSAAALAKAAARAREDSP